jgi:predicted Fe-Mo cluster-binding NifX family protein
MKILFTSTGTDWDAKIDPRFGRADYLLLFDEETEQLSVIDNRSIREVAHGAGPKTAQRIFELKADILITGNGPGGNAKSILDNTNLKIYIGAGDHTIRSAYQAYQNNQLIQGA